MLDLPFGISLRSIHSLEDHPRLPEFGEIASFGIHATLKLEDINEYSKDIFKTIPESMSDMASMTIVELLQKYGYPLETHTVCTADGYILTLHRIPHGISKPSEKRSPILLMHGLLSSSHDWVCLGPEASLGLLLADAGYDVWLGNCRGNMYSQDHKYLKRSSSLYWDFSFYEKAIFDLPAMVDMILEITEQSKLFYVGHSIGATISYILCAEKPEYNKKFRVIFGIAPIMEHVSSPLIKIVSSLLNYKEILFSLFGANEFLPDPELIRQLTKFIYFSNSPTRSLGTNVVAIMCGFTPLEIDTDVLPIILNQTPSGVSTKEVIHIAQVTTSGKFCQYEYGNDINFKNIACPVVVFFGSSDWMSDSAEIGKFILDLGDTPKDFQVIDEKNLQHLDYLFGTNTPLKLYNALMNRIFKY